MRGVRRERPRPATFGLVMGVAASMSTCGDVPESQAFVARDSSGVEVMESHRPQQEVVWRTRQTPLLTLGVMGGEAHEEFSEITGLVRLASGGVVVADAGSQEVRFFDAEGRFLRAVGGPGEGPGEFSGLSGLGHTSEGGAWAYDFSLRRITWMDATGSITRLTSLSPNPPGLNPVGALPDGSFVLKQLWGVAATAEATEGGLRRDPVAVVRFDSSGAAPDTIALIPGREVFLTQEDGRGVMSTPPFGRNAVGALLGSDVVLGWQDDFELDIRAPDGALRRRMVLVGRETSLTTDEVRAFIESRVDAAQPQDRPAVRSSLSAMPFPERRPAYGPVMSGQDGSLWVGDWAMYPSVPLRWTIFDPSGRWLADAETPELFFPFDVGADWVLGVQRDELDVEYVTLYALDRRTPE